MTLLTRRKTLKSFVPITVHPRIRPLESDLSCYKCTGNIVFNGGHEPDKNIKSTHILIKTAMNGEWIILCSNLQAY
jgi:hypothetical protein